jgi:hypothetical protein
MTAGNSRAATVRREVPQVLRAVTLTVDAVTTPLLAQTVADQVSVHTGRPQWGAAVGIAVSAGLRYAVDVLERYLLARARQAAGDAATGHAGPDPDVMGAEDGPENRANRADRRSRRSRSTSRTGFGGRWAAADRGRRSSGAIDRPTAGPRSP